MQKRRYEMLLPLRYNDGRPIEEEKIYQTREELIARFDALAFQPGVVQGTWIQAASLGRRVGGLGAGEGEGEVGGVASDGGQCHQHSRR